MLMAEKRGKLHFLKTVRQVQAGQATENTSFSVLLWIETMMYKVKKNNQKKKEKKKHPLLINRLKYKSDSNGFHDEKRNQLILYDMENECFEQLTTADADHTFEDFSPETKSVLFSANLNEDADAELTNDLFLFNL